MFERFSDGARKSVALGREEALRLRHDYIGTEHLLLGVLGQPEDPAVAVLIDAGLDLVTARGAVARLLGAPHPGVDEAALAAIGVDLEAVREAVEATFGAGALDVPAGPPKRGRSRVPRFTDRAKQVLALAVRAAVRQRSERIELGHLLLGILREGGGIGVRVVRESGVDLAAVERAVERTLESKAA
ncbi:Clp protease N-terminal domain-containing protein [Kitasatospora sp. MAP5-34]|uniref:Clp protease N-terminal domain-containing protein n=1 Tax=Kitasatospora sp. MAP5-34 TaxID=3035102 RepID=UPI0024752153|nr:Clp protease N-terminal domain-containing protein [Kitasatospora sp. MAP5-34]MDH6576552.1 ATP-dependent Clp protease ATP-binding subunit ClpA [Kitasatospora sp. MAP5-34]